MDRLRCVMAAIVTGILPASVMEGADADHSARCGSPCSVWRLPLRSRTHGARAPVVSVFSRMTPTTRRVLQAVLYEAGAIAFVGPVLGFAFGKPASSTFLLAVVLSTIALCWNYVFNALFERWESRQVAKGRNLARRVAHGTGFEGGLTILLVPVMACWLETSLLTAFVANLGLLAFFFVYAIAYTWLFDRVFGLPESARGP